MFKFKIRCSALKTIVGGVKVQSPGLTLHSGTFHTLHGPYLITFLHDARVIIKVSSPWSFQGEDWEIYKCCLLFIIQSQISARSWLDNIKMTLKLVRIVFSRLQCQSLTPWLSLKVLLLSLMAFVAEGKVHSMTICDAREFRQTIASYCAFQRRDIHVSKCQYKQLRSTRTTS